MLATVKKWGNSAAVRLPASVIEEAKLALEQNVDVRVENGKVIIEPVVCNEYDIAALVSGITNDNKHAEVDYGKPVGKEAW